MRKKDRTRRYSGFGRSGSEVSIPLKGTSSLRAEGPKPSRKSSPCLVTEKKEHSYVRERDQKGGGGEKIRVQICVKAADAEGTAEFQELNTTKGVRTSALKRGGTRSDSAFLSRWGVPHIAVLTGTSQNWGRGLGSGLPVCSYSHGAHNSTWREIRKISFGTIEWGRT